MKKYKFDEDDGITQKDFTKAKKHTYENPLFVKGKLFDFKLYTLDKKLNIIMFHSFDRFTEII